MNNNSNLIATPDNILKDRNVALGILMAMSLSLLTEQESIDLNMIATMLSAYSKAYKILADDRGRQESQSYVNLRDAFFTHREIELTTKAIVSFYGDGTSMPERYIRSRIPLSVLRDHVYPMDVRKSAIMQFIPIKVTTMDGKVSFVLPSGALAKTANSVYISREEYWRRVEDEENLMITTHCIAFVPRRDLSKLEHSAVASLQYEPDKNFGDLIDDGTVLELSFKGIQSVSMTKHDKFVSDIMFTDYGAEARQSDVPFAHMTPKEKELAKHGIITKRYGFSTPILMHRYFQLGNQRDFVVQCDKLYPNSNIAFLCAVFLGVVISPVLGCYCPYGYEGYYKEEEGEVFGDRCLPKGKKNEFFDFKPGSIQAFVLADMCVTQDNPLWMTVLTDYINGRYFCVRFEYGLCALAEAQTLFEPGFFKYKGDEQIPDDTHFTNVWPREDKVYTPKTNQRSICPNPDEHYLPCTIFDDPSYPKSNKTKDLPVLLASNVEANEVFSIKDSTICSRGNCTMGSEITVINYDLTHKEFKTPKGNFYLVTRPPKLKLQSDRFLYRAWKTRISIRGWESCNKDLIGSDCDHVDCSRFEFEDSALDAGYQTCRTLKIAWNKHCWADCNSHCSNQVLKSSLHIDPSNRYYDMHEYNLIHDIPTQLISDDDELVVGSNLNYGIGSIFKTVCKDVQGITYDCSPSAVGSPAPESFGGVQCRKGESIKTCVKYVSDLGLFDFSNGCFFTGDRSPKLNNVPRGWQDLTNRFIYQPTMSSFNGVIFASKQLYPSAYDTLCGTIVSISNECAPQELGASVVIETSGIPLCLDEFGPGVTRLIWLNTTYTRAILEDQKLGIEYGGKMFDHSVEMCEESGGYNPGGSSGTSGGTASWVKGVGIAGSTVIALAVIAGLVIAIIYIIKSCKKKKSDSNSVGSGVTINMPQIQPASDANNSPPDYVSVYPTAPKSVSFAPTPIAPVVVGDLDEPEVSTQRESIFIYDPESSEV